VDVEPDAGAVADDEELAGATALLELELLVLELHAARTAAAVSAAPGATQRFH
jgi:hypothetical protein